MASSGDDWLLVPRGEDDLSHLAGCIIRNLSEVNPANGAIARDHIDMIREELGSDAFRAGLEEADMRTIQDFVVVCPLRLLPVSQMSLTAGALWHFYRTRPH